MWRTFTRTKIKFRYFTRNVFGVIFTLRGNSNLRKTESADKFFRDFTQKRQFYYLRTLSNHEFLRRKLKLRRLLFCCFWYWLFFRSFIKTRIFTFARLKKRLQTTLPFVKRGLWLSAKVFGRVWRRRLCRMLKCGNRIVRQAKLLQSSKRFSRRYKPRFWRWRVRRKFMR